MKKTFSLMLAAMMLMTMAVTSMAVTPTAITLGTDAQTGMVLQGGLLKPGEEYRFPLSISSNGSTPLPLTEELLETYSFKASNVGKGKTIDSIKLTRYSGNYYVTVDVKDGWPTSSTEEEYALKLTNKSDSNLSAELKVMFETGYKLVDDADIDAMHAEDVIEVDNATPVYAKEQLARIARLNNYKKVNFEGSNWNYNVNITDMPSVNLLHNTDSISAILTKYENNNFEFLNFPANSKFINNGIMEIDVTDISVSYGQRFFVYRYFDGKLTPLAASYNHEDELLSISTNVLGSFVITDKQLDSTVVTPPTTGNDSGNVNGNNPEIINPSTGVAV